MLSKEAVLVASVESNIGISWEDFLDDSQTHAPVFTLGRDARLEELSDIVSFFFGAIGQDKNIGIVMFKIGNQELLILGFIGRLDSIVQEIGNQPNKV